MRREPPRSTRLDTLFPDTTLFRSAGGKLAAYADETGVDAIGLDETVDPAWADAALPAHLPVQGNLDPLALVAGGAALDAAIDRILAAFPVRPHLLHLGHGIVPDTPIDRKSTRLNSSH